MKLANLLRRDDTGAVTARLLVSIALVAASSGAGALALGGAASAAPLAAGFTLNPILKASDGTPVCDPLDNSPSENDIACAGGVSTYFGIDDSTVAASVVLEVDPRQTGTPGPIKSTTYVVLLGVGGTHVASFGIDGKETNDKDYLYAGCLGVGLTHEVKASAALADDTITIVPDGPYFRMTFNVPRSAFDACIPGGTSVTPFVGTSQAGPLDKVNKDHFFGSAVDFSAINVAPTAKADADTVDQDSTGNEVDVLSNDSDDKPKSELSVVVTTPAGDGTATWNALTRKVEYTPDAGFSGSDSFGYTITDAAGLTSTATVAVTVTKAAAGNRAPVAVDDTHTATTGAAGRTVEVLVNDSDPDGDALTITSVSTTGTLGSLVLSLIPNQLTYTPPAIGATTASSDSFTYAVSDGKGGTDTATVTVALLHGNRGPTAVDDTVTTPHGRPVDVAVLGNDSDPDGDVLTITGVTGAASGTVTQAGGVLTYTPSPGFSGSDSFTYSVSDGRGLTGSAVVRVTVGAASVVQPPVGTTPSETAAPAPSPSAGPTSSAGAEPSPSAEAAATPTSSPISGFTSPEPVAGGGSVEQTVEQPSTTPVRGVEEEPATAPAAAVEPRTLPFTGGSTGTLLALAAGLSLGGLALTLLGRRRRSA